MMDAPPKLTENGLCRSNSLAHYDAGFTERPSHHPQIQIDIKALPVKLIKLVFTKGLKPSV
jgi:hypothetical protein